MFLDKKSKLAKAMVLTAAFTAAAACTQANKPDTEQKVDTGPKATEHQQDSVMSSWKAKPSDYVSPGPRG